MSRWTTNRTSDVGRFAVARVKRVTRDGVADVVAVFVRLQILI